MERRSLLASILIHAAALLLAAVILAPILWLFVMSISPAADLAAKPLRWWPETMDFSRYAALLSFGDHAKEISGGFRLTTNNRMEILAVIEA